MVRILVLLAGAVVSLSAVASQAQDAVLGQLYGSGVHAYFAGDYFKAHEQLTSAVTSGSRDPRVYYYRGLSYLKLGRDAEATQDFQKGAELESKDLHRSYNVARSLERIQGTARQQLETYRVKARMTAMEEANKIRKARFEAIQREEQRVLRAQTAPAPAAPAEPIEKPEAQAETDPFGNPAEPKATAPVAEEKATEEKATEPMAETPAAPPAETPAAPPAEAPAAPPAEKTDDPFGGSSAEEPAKPAETIPEEPAVAKPAEATAEKPAESKAAPPKKSILNALLKGSGESIKKSLGGVGNMAKGMGVPGMKAPGGMAPPAMPGATPDNSDPFGAGGEVPAAPPAKAGGETPATEQKPADDPFGVPAAEPAATPPAPPAGEAKESPFQEEPAPAEKPAEEKPAEEKPADKPAEPDPFA